ncbi:hypothetical protein [Effusibacillus pohliae]|uniref:hypothetical protein n=1 Tax=Effusibacillus pohliae TaxID=232270 RepID=UPI0003A283FA|nr:hypothetical protein [Effusibacillus pohliae]
MMGWLGLVLAAGTYEGNGIVLIAVVKAYDGRIPPTVLTECVFAHFGIADVDQLLERVYDRPLSVQEIARLSRYALIDDLAVQEIRERGRMNWRRWWLLPSTGSAI